MKKPNIGSKELAKKYSRSDMTKVAEARAVLKQLRESGVATKGYELASPYGHKIRPRADSGLKLK